MFIHREDIIVASMSEILKLVWSSHHGNVKVLDLVSPPYAAGNLSAFTFLMVLKISSLTIFQY